MVPPYSDRISRVPPYFSHAQYHRSLFAYGAITRYGQPFHAALLRVLISRAGFSDFARHYFRNLGWCLFLELLRCFSSPGSPRMTMYSSCDTFAGGFPHSEISGSKLICQLPEAYRRLSRLSSPIIAKASTMCSYSLDPITLISQNYFQGMIVWSFTKRVMPYLSIIEITFTLARNQKFLLTQSKNFSKFCC